MDFKKFAIDHVNNNHLDSLESIYKTNINEKFEEIKLVDYDLESMFLIVDNKEIKIPFTKPLKDLSEFKDMFIAMSQQSEAGFDATKVQDELRKFIKEYNSVMLGSVMNSNPVVSYAPLIKHDNKFYIYISQMAEHYAAIKQNPDLVRMMLIEDEKQAPSVINRKRLTLKCKARFVERNTSEFNNVFDTFESTVGTSGGVSMIREMEDFSLIELTLINGRLYLGFGQVYNVKNDLSITMLNVSTAPNHIYKK